MAWQGHRRSSRVYVSYSGEADKETPVVDELGELIAQHGLEFRRDVEQVKYGDSIKRFMDEIGAADNIIPVLSRRYFRSEFCMYELLHVWNHGNFGTRVHPIALPDFELGAWRTQVDLVEFWNHEAAALQRALAGLPAAQTPDLYRRLAVIGEFSAHINNLVAFLADLNITPLGLLQKQKYAPLLDRIEPSKPPQRLQRRADAEFLNRIRAEIEKLLAKHPRLSAALLAKARVAFRDDRRDLLAILVEEPPEVAFADILHPGTKERLSTLDAQSGDFQDTWHDTKQILGWTCLLAVDPEWIARMEERSEAGSMEFRILGKTLTAVEVGIARFNQIAASFRWEKGRNEAGAEADLPNGLVEILGNGAFTVPWLPTPIGVMTGMPTPLVVITTNEERELPAAFVRRCLVLNLHLPKQREPFIDWLVGRGRLHFGEQCQAEVYVEAARQLWDDRQAAETQGPRPARRSTWISCA